MRCAIAACALVLLSACSNHGSSTDAVRSASVTAADTPLAFRHVFALWQGAARAVRVGFFSRPLTEGERAQALDRRELFPSLRFEEPWVELTLFFDPGTEAVNAAAVERYTFSVHEGGAPVTLDFQHFDPAAIGIEDVSGALGKGQALKARLRHDGTFFAKRYDWDLDFTVAPR